ncbi:hypothetical protein HPP92_008495 [Vanilla planifolia]|uniref:RING-type E3 ubiquitin transferase n=1 Tax=Vanilla planifolia TaxID=51239 RepID=A0A835R2K6_VANPL|nr:hypothetical protein HPP92_008495 [Vanilla planifolia]
MDSPVSHSVMGEIVEEMNSPEVAAAVEEKVYVALGKEHNEGKANLLWALQHFRCPIVIIHVHRPAKMIPILGGKFPASQLVKWRYKHSEGWKGQRCKRVKSEKLVIERDDVAKGLIDLIARYKITRLVMGEATSNNFFKVRAWKKKAPRSKIAISVKQNADPSCHIWFVCKGNLICTREADISFGLSQSQSCTPNSEFNSSPISIQSEQLSRTLAQGKSGNSRFLETSNQIFWNIASSGMLGFHEAVTPPRITYPSPDKTSSPESCCTFGRSIAANSSEKFSLRSLKSSCCSSSSGYEEEVLSNSDFQSVKDEESEVGLILDHRLHVSDATLKLSQPHQLEEGGIDVELYQILKDALAKELENFYVKELSLRKEVEEALGTSQLEVEMLKNQHDELYEELHKTNKTKLLLETHIVDYNGRVKNLEEKLLVACSLLDSLQSERVLLQRGQHQAVQEAEGLQRKKEIVPTIMHECPTLTVFSFLEIEQATCNFSSLLKIGEGGSGMVYKGFLRNTTVAIKTLKPNGMRGRPEFNQEVSILNRTRHPNLVNLMGVCPEASALVYEYLPNGNLEDCIACNNNNRLPWQSRTRIVTEICSALIFLHSSKPHPVVHGDLKPENILLDSNLVSKLSDFGLCDFVMPTDTTTTLDHQAQPNNAFVYMDPELLVTGDLTPCSDVYSFGVVILRLLTGMPAIGIIKKVQEALEEDAFYEIIDPTAGNWPLGYAKKLAKLGLRCCETSRKNRPDLLNHVWKELELMLKAATSTSFNSITDDNSFIPSYFTCPISQEVMKDPYIAADGFTYEGEALRGWIYSGRNTSPMTNLKLPHCELIPNRALRSAIQEWLQKQPKQL